MALDDTSVTLPGKGFVFMAAAGTEIPVATQAALDALDLTSNTIATGWSNFGHTSRENNVTIDSDVNEGDVKGSWQNANLRKVADTVTRTLAIGSLQMTNETLELYYAGGDSTEPDIFWAKGDAPQERAVFVALVDGAERSGFYQPRVSFGADGGVEMDPENFLEFSLKGTFLDQTGAKGILAWLRSGLGTPAAG